MTSRLAATFDELVDKLAPEDPIALVLGWWCRVEKSLTYYTIAFHGKRFRNAVSALRVMESDARVAQDVVDHLHNLRKRRNAIAHGEVMTVTPEEAKSFATEAWKLGWLIGETVPNELAISSGAALAA